MPARTRLIGPDDSDHLAELIRKRREVLGLDYTDLSAAMLTHRCDRHPDGCKISASVLYSIENGVPVNADRRDTELRYRSRLITVDELVAFIHVLDLDRGDINLWLFG